MRPFSIAATCGLALTLAFVVACSEDLGGPQVRACDESLTVTIDDPSTLTYLVSVAGDAAVSSVMFTTPAGDSTVNSPPDQAADEILFVRDFDFAAGAEATLRVLGEVAQGGEIGITYIVDPFVGSNINGPISLCALL